MKLVEALSSHPHVYAGHGTNHEGEAFVGRLETRPLVNGSAVILEYTATREDGKHLHKEATLLATNQDGKLCLWPVMEELPFVMPHVEVRNEHHENGNLAVVFASGPREALAVFREEITIELTPAGELTYAHSWGMPGEGFKARSRCLLFEAGT